MIQQWLNWRTAFTFIAVCIVAVTIFYSNYLSEKLAKEERQKVELWVEAQRTILDASDQANFNLATHITTENDDVPIIETNEKDSITGNVQNLDTNAIKTDKDYLPSKLKAFKQEHAPIVLLISEKPYVANKYYYGESALQIEVRYYPIVQMIILFLFIIITIVAQRSRYENMQNQVWAGLAKETAHQLGTPVTSLEGWLEMLRDTPGTEKVIAEMEKDVNRLKLISDRFGKIGSKPKLEERNVVEQITSMVEYIRKRASGKIQFNINSHGEQDIPVMISPPLFDWVIENLLKNALDAIEGKGNIEISIKDEPASVVIDVSDTGRGISRHNVTNVFKPGFTTKKRGWGLGLTLSRRIVEHYHKGQIFVKSSEPGKGTKFRVVLSK